MEYSLLLIIIISSLYAHGIHATDYSTDSCASVTCFNGATCFTGPHASYFCNCSSGFTGTHCSQEIGTSGQNTTSAPVPAVAPCVSNTCANGGTCYTGMSGSFYCQCPSGFTGTNCEREVQNQNYCSPDPCTNGGTCYTGQNGFICICSEGFDGPLCETQITQSSCNSNPCGIHGTCYTDATSSDFACVCDSGYTGSHCESGICIDVHCQNNGTCVTSSVNASDVVCVCQEHFSGDRCQFQSDYCVAYHPCQNGGTCFTSSDNRMEYVCMCPDGFEGSQCEQDKVTDHCAPNPCLNGGLCTMPLDPMNDMIMCLCTTGFVGVRCERIDTGEGACVDDACLNGGTCQPDIHSLSGRICICPATHTGDDCEIQVPLACESSPCLNGATCDNVGDGDYSCICQEGYAGRRCEVQGPCASLPCLNGGRCLEDVYNPGEYLCLCDNQYTGTMCETPPQEDPCNSFPCQNNGSCIPTTEGTGYRCDCPADFVGLKCDTRDPCSSSPCLNDGVCNAIPATGSSWTFLCVCSDQYLGFTCGVQRACVSNPCMNGGECVDIPESASQPIYGTELTSEMLNYNCRCVDDWTGQNCETQIIDPCASNPCKNNGTCFRSHSSDRFFCSCLEGFYAPFCEADPCSADPAPCRNGATCQSFGPDFMCLCSIGYTGNNCSVEVCQTNPCKNGGTCTPSSTDADFECSCVDGYLGTDCSLLDPCSQKPCMNSGVCLTVRRDANTVDFQCLCQLGYGGLTCGVDFGEVNKCVLNLCENGGSCYQGADLSSGRYVCVCTGDFEGEHCDRPITHPLGSGQDQLNVTCAQNPCLNGGTCFTSADSSTYTCVCPEAFTGPICENEVATTMTAPTTVPTAPTTAPTTVPTAPTTAFTGCRYAGQTYTNGETWQDGCRDCLCENGLFSCNKDRCSCTWNGLAYSNGESWFSGCELCSCVSGTASCSDMNCRDRCIHESTIYNPGTNRTDSCNTCTCQKGAWTCTNNACGHTCTYGSSVYLANEERRENCNTCSCYNGQWICTERACSADPIVIKVEFDFTNDFSDVTAKQEQFIAALHQNLQMLLKVQDYHIQNLTISEGSIKVNLNLVESKTDNINIENVAVILETAVSRNSYTFRFEGSIYTADPNSYKMARQDEPVPAPVSNTLIIIIVVVCGVMGILLVVVSVWCMVKKHSTGRDITDYGEDRLPRRWDKSFDSIENGFENGGYDKDQSSNNI